MIGLGSFGFGFAFGRVSDDVPPCPRLDLPAAAVPSPPRPPVRGYMLLGACWHGTKWGRQPNSSDLWPDYEMPPLCRKPFGYPAELALMTHREARLMAKRWQDPMGPALVLGQVKAWATVRLTGNPVEPRAVRRRLRALDGRG